MGIIRWPSLLPLDTPEQQEKFIHSFYKICGIKHPGKHFVGMEAFKQAIFIQASISPTKIGHTGKRVLIERLLMQYESQLMRFVCIICWISLRMIHSFLGCQLVVDSTAVRTEQRKLLQDRV